MSTQSNSSAIILFHGVTGTPAEMKDLAKFLHHKGFEVILPRLSGHNGSVAELRRVHAVRWIEESEQVLREVASANYQSLFVGGLSFGSLLALHLATQYAKQVRGVVLLSLPLHLKSRFKEVLLNLLSYLPEVCLDKLGVVPKPKRPAATFVTPREGYDVHSIAAAARVVRIRRQVISRLKELCCPTLLLQDPADHHISQEVPDLLKRNARAANIRVKWFPGGQHELTLGHRRQEVFEEVYSFVNKIATKGPKDPTSECHEK